MSGGLSSRQAGWLRGATAGGLLSRMLAPGQLLWVPAAQLSCLSAQGHSSCNASVSSTWLLPELSLASTAAGRGANNCWLTEVPFSSNSPLSMCGCCRLADWLDVWSVCCVAAGARTASTPTRSPGCCPRWWVSRSAGTLWRPSVLNTPLRQSWQHRWRHSGVLGAPLGHRRAGWQRHCWCHLQQAAMSVCAWFWARRGLSIHVGEFDSCCSGTHLHLGCVGVLLATQGTQVWQLLHQAPLLCALLCCVVYCAGNVTLMWHTP